MIEEPAPNVPEQYTSGYYDREYSNSLQRADTPEAVEKKQEVEAYHKLVGRSYIIDKIVKSESAELPKIEWDGRANIEIGSNENPAHAFKALIVPRNETDEVPQEKIDQVMDQIEQHFQNNQELAALFRMKTGETGSVVGMTNPTGEVPIEEVVSQLYFLQERVNELLSDSGEMLIMISDFQETALGVTKITDRQLVVDATQAAGLTYLSWAEAKWKKDPSFRQEAGNLLWVTSHKQEKLRSIVRKTAPDSQISDDRLYDHLSDPLEFSPSKAPEAKVRVRTINLDPTSLTEYSANYNQRVDRMRKAAGASKTEYGGDYSINMMPSREFLKKHIPDWRQQVETKGKVEWSVKGAHTVMKFDISGLSKMVAQGGQDPTETITQVLKGVGAPADEIFGKDNYLMAVEGDALTMFIPGDTGSTTELIKRFVEFSEQSGSNLLLHLDSVKQNTGTTIGEDKIGLKRVFFVSENEETQVTIRRGGLTTIYNQSLEAHEAVAERFAKIGINDTTIVTDRPLTLREEQAAFGGREGVVRHLVDKKKRSIGYAYSIETALTPLELRFYQFLSSESGKQYLNDFEDAGKAIREMRRAEMQSAEDNSIKVSNENNNDLALARIAYTMASHQTENWDTIIKSVYSGETADRILDIYKQAVDPEGVRSEKVNKINEYEDVQRLVNIMIEMYYHLHPTKEAKVA